MNNIQVETVEDHRFGIRIYRNALNNQICDTEFLEEVMARGKVDYMKWSHSQIGDLETVKSYRNSYDCILRQENVKYAGEEYKDFLVVYNELISILKKCVDHYSEPYGIQMKYIEAVNYLKYEPSEYFNVHSDASWSYVCTVSTVSYLNDDYTGGELHFPIIGYTYTPRKGDILICPSNFIYQHGAKPLISGVKYSVATMFDYNSRFHKYPHGYNEDGTVATER